MYTLFTDTDTDITPEIATRYGYKLISMPYTIDGKQIFPYVDFKEFDYKEFYMNLQIYLLFQLTLKVLDNLWH